MKYFAKQIPWEEQDSRIYMEGWDNEAIILHGNRDYETQTTEAFDRYIEGLSDIDYYMENAESYGYANADEVIEDTFIPEHKGRYTAEDFAEWHKILDEVDGYADSEKSICEALRLMTGKKYAWKQISGCCQRDWQTMYYPVDEWTEESLDAFEMLYFNTGSEWLVWCEDAEEDDAVGYYATSYDAREWLENELCCEGDELVMYEFTGYSRVANWQEV